MASNFHFDNALNRNGKILRTRKFCGCTKNITKEEITLIDYNWKKTITSWLKSVTSYGVRN